MAQAFSVLAACILGLSWTVSSHFFPWTSWHSEFLAYLSVVLISWRALYSVSRRPVELAVPIPRAVLPFIGLGLIAVIQRALGLVPFWGDVWTFGFYLSLCIMCATIGYASGLLPIQPRGHSSPLHPCELLALAFVVGGLASTVIGLAQVFSLWEHSDWIVRSDALRRPGGNLGQPNHLATLLVMAIASLVFLRQSRKVGGAASILILFMLGVGIVISESRSGALSLLALLCWWLLKRRAFGDLTSPRVGIGASIVFVGAFLAWPHFLNAMGLLSYRAEDRVLEGSLRFQVWPQLLRALAARPWTGWGILQVAAAHNTVADDYVVSEPYSYSHNLLLDLAMWIGVPLALLFAGVSALWIFRRVRQTNQLLPWYGLAVALPLGLHSMLEYPYAYAYFLAPAMFLLGSVEASTATRPSMRLAYKPIATALVVVTAALSWSVVEYLEIEADFRVARLQAAHFGGLPLNYSRPKIILFDQLDVLLVDTRISPEPSMQPEMMELVKKAALRYPWWGTQYRYAMALALNGNPVEAARQIQVMRRMWGEKAYLRLKKQIAELAANKYPELNQLNLP